MKIKQLKAEINAEELARRIYTLKQYSLNCVRNDANFEELKMVHRAKLDAYQKVLEIVLNMQLEE